MPKPTFFNLPKEKQTRLLRAAQVEFSRVPFHEASIAKIVKAAEISRGSFYQYFEDKEDLYYYYFEQNRKTTFGDLAEILAECKGDLFASYEKYFAKMIEEYLAGENWEYYRNVFTGMDYRASQRLTPEGPDQERMKMLHKSHHIAHREEFKKIRALINTDELNVNNEEELRLLMRMTMHTFFTTIAAGFRKLAMNENAKVADVTAEFKLQMNWLKNGAVKQKE